jgi:hypothetical protein
MKRDSSYAAVVNRSIGVLRADFVKIFYKGKQQELDQIKSQQSRTLNGTTKTVIAPYLNQDIVSFDRKLTAFTPKADQK